MQDAMIVDGRVAQVGEEIALAPGECALIVPVGPEVEVGWAWTPQGCEPPEEPAPGPVTVAHSYLLADAQTVDELREALAVILGL